MFRREPIEKVKLQFCYSIFLELNVENNFIIYHMYLPYHSSGFISTPVQLLGDEISIAFPPPTYDNRPNTVPVYNTPLAT